MSGPTEELNSGVPTAQHRSAAPGETASEPIANGIRIRDHVASGTAFHATVGWCVFWAIVVLVFLFTMAITNGVAIILWLASPILIVLARRRSRAIIRGNSIQVGVDQFPEVHQSVCRLAEQLQLPTPPDVFIVKGGTESSTAIKHGSRSSIVLTDEMLYGSTSTGDPQVLDFVIGHELAHYAFGHKRLFRRMMASTYRAVSRLDDFSCDAVAHSLIDNRQSAAGAIVLMTIGPHLLPQVNLKAFVTQAEQVVADGRSRRAELGLYHPLLLRRFARVIGMKVT
ncbi:MAG: M48 family metalloprotease [Pirellulaceae bacterium]|nr:M48 family metalloprotease [Pirellulaceae bacterium]